MVESGSSGDVWTNGCFDLLHPGHVELLVKARSLFVRGNMRLCVGVNTDDAVRRSKGDNRPIMPESARVFMLSQLSCVDVVCLFSSDDFSQTILWMKPAIYFKSSEYSLETMNQAERRALDRVGSRIEFVKRAEFKDMSTSSLCQAISRK